MHGSGGAVMSIISVLLSIAAAFLIAVFLEIYRELHHFCITRYETSSQKLAGFHGEVRIVFLSDLHNRVYGKHNESLLKAVEEEQPDLILIGGDMLVGKKGAPYDTALDFVKRLPSICPVCYAPGNHESRMKEDVQEYGCAYFKYKELLEESGVTFLENAAESVIIKGQELLVCGLELPAEAYRKFRKSDIRGVDIQSCLPDMQNSGGSDTSARKQRTDCPFTVLLAHNPAYMDAYLEWGADLILSGHLHGGLVRIPGIGGIVTPQGFLFPRYSGEMRKEKDQTVIVSRGLGTHTLNIRLFNMPELITVRIKKSL